MLEDDDDCHQAEKRKDPDTQDQEPTASTQELKSKKKKIMSESYDVRYIDIKSPQSVTRKLNNLNAGAAFQFKPLLSVVIDHIYHQCYWSARIRLMTTKKRSS